MKEVILDSELVFPMEAGDLWITQQGEWIQVMWLDDDSIAIVPGIILSHAEFHDLVCTCTYVGIVEDTENAGIYGIRDDFDAGEA